MPQAKGPTEQVNYTGTRKPFKSEQNWAKVSLVARAKLISVTIVQGLHILALYAQLHTSDVLRRAVGESDILPALVEWESPSPFAKPLEPVSTKHQARHLDASLNKGEETDLFEVEVKPEKYAQSVYSTAEDPHGTRVGRTFFSHLQLGVTKDMSTKDMTKLLGCKWTLPPLATHCQKISPSH